MKIIMIAAISVNNVLGVDGDLPWHSKRDMAMFKDVTTRARPYTVNTVVMGRKTYESIGQPLSNRHTCVLTRGGWKPPIMSNNLTVCHDMDEVNKIATNHGGALYICGGESIYRLYFPICDEVILTRFDTIVEEYDSVFPIGMLDGFHSTMGEIYPADDVEPHGMTVQYYKRGGLGTC